MPKLEPDCVVEEKSPGIPAVVLRECLRDAQGHYVIDPVTADYAMPAADVDVCFAYRVDSDGQQTPDPNDDMSPKCVAYHYNLEFRIARRFGVPAPEGTAVTAICENSELPQIDCPSIGGPD